MSYKTGWVLHKDIPEDKVVSDNEVVIRPGELNGIIVDPAQIAQSMMGQVSFSTGFIPDNILYHAQTGLKQTVVGYRKRQKTGIWLEGIEQPLRVPLPPLILIRKSTAEQRPDYRLFACAKHPESLNEPLYHAPLPNVYNSGNICWGSVSRPVPTSISLKADWEALLGSRFGNHACGGKCKSHPSDIRQFLMELNANQNRRVYPMSELIPKKMTLRQALGIEEETTHA